MSWSEFIDIPCDIKKLEDISSSIRNGNADGKIIDNYMNSEIREVQFIIFGYLWNKYYPTIQEKAVSSFILNFLSTSLKEGLENEYRMGRYTAAQYLLWWFEASWQRKEVSENADIMDRIKDSLAECILAGNSTVIEVIKLTILEHLFQNADIANYYASWKDDKTLSSEYQESIELANGFGEKENKGR